MNAIQKFLIWKWICGFVLVVLKVSGVISWPWLVVTFPFWAIPGGALFMLVFVMASVLVVFLCLFVAMCFIGELEAMFNG